MARSTHRQVVLRVSSSTEVTGEENALAGSGQQRSSRAAVVPSGQARDEIADQRERKPRPPRPRQAVARLSDSERERYELRIDAYQVQLAAYRAKLEEYAVQLQAAHHDGLTGTWLRHAGRQLLEEELQRSARDDTPLAIAFVDLDGLKARNDRHGHAAGDQALVTVARALLKGLRRYDHVVRWGGDEFLCVLPGLTQHETARRLAQARRLITAECPGLTISIGIAEKRPCEDADAFVSRADRALYVSRLMRQDR